MSGVRLDVALTTYFCLHVLHRIAYAEDELSDDSDGGNNMRTKNGVVRGKRNCDQ